MTALPLHRSRVLGSPWPGVHAVVIDSTRSFAKHFHATYGIGVLERGAHRSASGRGQVDAYTGDLLACNPGEVHDGRPLHGVPSRCWRMVHLEPEAIASMADPDEPSSDFAFERPAFGDPALRAALCAFLDRLGRWSSTGVVPDVDLLAGEQSLATVCHLMRPHRSIALQPGGTDRHLLRVRERLADTTVPAPSLAELATLADLGKYQLLRRFSRAYGLSPHAWLLQHRADQARRLIREEQPLSTAALAAGFADQSHMTRVFSRQFGFTPGDWQRAAMRRRPQ